MPRKGESFKGVPENEAASTIQGNMDIARFGNANDPEINGDTPVSIENVEPALSPQALAAKESLRVVETLLKTGSKKELDGLKGEFLSKVPAEKANEALAELSAALQQQKEVYLDIGKSELAAEIEAFARSLESLPESSTEAKTAGGKAYLKKLEAGDFASLEDANYALNDLTKDAKTPEEQAAINAEFNVLFAKAHEKLMTGTEGAGKLPEVSAEEVDDIFAGLEGGATRPEPPKSGVQAIEEKDIDNLLSGLG